METARFTTELVNLVCTGLLAGGFLMTRFGLRPAAASLDPYAQVALRKGVIPVLQALVPKLFLLGLASSIAVSVVDGTTAGAVPRIAAPVLLLVAVVVTMAGNVPLNRQMLSWAPDSPPPGWQAAIARWNRFDSIRSLAAIAVFLLQALAMGLRLGG